MKNFKTRKCKILSCDYNILFHDTFKVVLEEIEAIEITKEEFDVLMTRKNPFKDYNTSKTKYNAFVIYRENLYRMYDEDCDDCDEDCDDNYTLYILTNVCEGYHGFKKRCNNCLHDMSYCMTWSCYCSESLSHNIHVCREDEDTDNKKYIWEEDIDDKHNYYMYYQLELQSEADESEFTHIDTSEIFGLRD